MIKVNIIYKSVFGLVFILLVEFVLLFCYVLYEVEIF